MNTAATPPEKHLPDPLASALERMNMPDQDKAALRAALAQVMTPTQELPASVEVAAEPPKWWMQSRTMLLNGVVVALAGTAELMQVIEPNLGLLHDLLSPSSYATVLAALAGANALLRCATASGITFRRPAIQQANTPPAGG
ncbi:hypothetical protein VITFI_CDS1526 [Vitreoscilla filiformis]|uniref:Uncharacterized protein n=1 Tax=Vitreoscilla filiformis TaxID=63 RepID=A0A221KDD0_VITFI|nr:hypothetical protein [Vitreoscilla filiformis]ASM75897.1 hypothetical protein VITFI_CDS0118 [Vitreoscilla filiformis]ASM76429.1 hypothetical protein VITFI_CDS0650 [Vitreoscilla filiformis]ASM76847.1 hypothetical protein VITFI_CDS1069 [Vitreoscilla filiformis]ASM77304.1 hypothetical protein VITFI_CDS1526 [Vitreoscilla filiformis]